MDTTSEQNTPEVQCTFRTQLPEKYQVDEALEIQLNTTSTNADLNQVVKQIMEDEARLEGADLKEVKTRKLQFMVNDVFLTTTLQELMDKLGLESEQVVTIFYSFSLDKPKQKLSIP